MDEVVVARDTVTREGSFGSTMKLILLQAEDAEKFPEALVGESLGSFLSVSKRCPCLTTTVGTYGEHNKLLAVSGAQECECSDLK